MVPNPCGLWLRSMRRSIVVNDSLESLKSTISINTRKNLKRRSDRTAPHLFLISDEFAELKVNQPDFIKELVSIARVGRSLGVHLILATQKPSGVVDDQIWSNSRFKIALRWRIVRTQMKCFIHRTQPRSLRQDVPIYRSGIMKSMSSSSLPGQGQITSRTRTIWGLRTIPST